MEKELTKFSDKILEIGSSYGEDLVEAYKETCGKEIPDDMKEAMEFTLGYTSARFSIQIFIEYIFPMIKKIRNYFLVIVVSFIFLIMALILIWSTIDINSFTIFLVFIVPSIIGIIISSLKGYKWWSEAKKNLAEAKKIELEIQ